MSPCHPAFGRSSACSIGSDSGDNATVQSQWGQSDISVGHVPHLGAHAHVAAKLLWCEVDQATLKATGAVAALKPYERR